jgi:hypothetical protein
VSADHFSIARVDLAGETRWSDYCRDVLERLSQDTNRPLVEVAGRLVDRERPV